MLILSNHELGPWHQTPKSTATNCETSSEACKSQCSRSSSWLIPACIGHGLVLSALHGPRLFAAISGGLEWRQAVDARTCNSCLHIFLQACNVIFERGWLGVDLPLHSAPSSTLVRFFFVIKLLHCINKHARVIKPHPRPCKTFKSGPRPGTNVWVVLFKLGSFSGPL